MKHIEKITLTKEQYEEHRKFCSIEEHRILVLDFSKIYEGPATLDEYIRHRLNLKRYFDEEIKPTPPGELTEKKKNETLNLTLKRKWFEMILSGEKKEEYREIKKHWKQLLTDNKGYIKKYKYVKFTNGYGKHRPQITKKIIAIRKGRGVTKWGAEPGEEYFIIKLGEEIERFNIQNDF